MSIIYKNLTYQELIELAPEDKPFQVKVESNANGEGVPQLLWANILQGCLDTWLCNQEDISGIDYGLSRWQGKYKGKYDLILNPWDNFEREEFKVGDVVIDDGQEYRIINIEHNRFALTEKLDKSTRRYNVPLDDLMKLGKPTLQVTELSLKEIADKFEIPLNQLRIKE